MPNARIPTFGDYAICAPNIICVLLIMMVHQNSGEAMFMYYCFGIYHLLKHYYRSTPSNIINTPKDTCKYENLSVFGVSH
jgi:hypothetical protein